jgi:ubiquinone/menaquinone biosynthesis C-methylase UbiE
LAKTAVKEPERHWLQWKNRWNAHLRLIDRKIEKERSNPKLFKQLVAAKQKLNTLFNFSAPTPIEASLGQGTFHISETLVYRDWVWGWESELQTALERYARVLKPIDQEPVVVVGSGAGRLAFEWAKSFPKSQVHSVDLSPFFCQIQGALLRSAVIDWIEIPQVPRNFELIAEPRRIQALSPPASNVKVWWASALDLPFVDASINRVLVHWTLDVLDTPLATVFAEWNRVLKLGGCLQIEGPLSFESSKTPQYSSSQIQEWLQASGFQVSQQELLEVPYLQSPIEAARRTQQVLHIQAIKIEDLSQRKTPFDDEGIELESIRSELHRLSEKFKAQHELITALARAATWEDWEQTLIRGGIPKELTQTLKRQILDEVRR